MSSTPNKPVIADVLLATTKALPAAGASNQHAAIALEQTTQYPTSERMALSIDVPALPALADAKTATFTPQDSADGQSWAAIPELAPLVLTGAGGVGSAAGNRVWPLPGTTRANVRVDQAVASAGGDSTGVTATVQLLVRL